MSGITTHVLDQADGTPAAGMRVRLEIEVPGKGWVTLAERATDPNGRVTDFLAEGSPPDRGRYRLTFDAGAWQTGRGRDSFYGEIPIVFELREPSRHHHVPLLLSPFGYSTYRGS